ncbi:hypothetical protein L210DRAFT_3505086 [Boletus edulis BED1]|uniref:Uncharacterized protein n=1 Tax=Boletus edulis BED1 TaxID=1328754 RepID=A0AAD4BRF1_BOLED|nr:hypothetical protein L210DRAFT_3505086 [Boletus edulis BED1]
MDAREDLPKVSIETEQDWRRIQHNFSAALLARLDTELESHGQAGDKDALLPHAHQFLETLFDISRPNLRINGRTSITDEPCDDEDDLDMEPFDEALDRHIWSLSDQRLKWDKDVADRRRTRPTDIEKLIADGLTQHHDVETSETSNEYADFSAKQVDPELERTLLNTVSLAPRPLQSIQSLQNRSDKIKSVSAEVKALKP